MTVGTDHRVVEWRDLGDRIAPFRGNVEVEWAPQPGSQELFLACPTFEVLYHGTRGGGKTDCLLMDFASKVGTGLSRDWVGILFRQTYPQLDDVVRKSRKLFEARGLNEGRFNASSMTWTWPTGEQLMFRHAESEEDFDKYKGFNVPWLAFEELTTWADPTLYKRMMSICRSANPKVPLRVRATTNPYGPGHNWVKARFRLPHTGRVVGPLISDEKDDSGRALPPRRAIFSDIRENKILLKAQPQYLDILAASAKNPAEAEAWLKGSWDIVSGGMFDDIWGRVRDKAVVKPFVPPESWRIDRGFDWGSSRPFSVGWYAESDGTDLVFPDGRRMRTVPGDLFRFAEWYGWNGEPNKGTQMLAKEVAAGIIRREIEMGIHGRVKRGIADASIFDDTNGNSIARSMEETVEINGKKYHGVYFDPADKRSGTRKQGWEEMRTRLAATVAPLGKVREEPGLFVTETCAHFLRTVPTLPRDSKDPDDVDTKSEDHVADEVRYRVRKEHRVAKFGRTYGMT